jgi:hypothetical protein
MGCGSPYFCARDLKCLGHWRACNNNQVLSATEQRVLQDYYYRCLSWTLKPLKSCITGCTLGWKGRPHFASTLKPRCRHHHRDNLLRPQFSWPWDPHFQCFTHGVNSTTDCALYAHNCASPRSSQSACTKHPIICQSSQSHILPFPNRQSGWKRWRGDCEMGSHEDSRSLGRFWQRSRG